MFEFLKLESGMVIDVETKCSGEVDRLLIVSVDDVLHAYCKNGHWCSLYSVISGVREESEEIVAAYKYKGSHDGDMNQTPFYDKNLEIVWTKKLKVKWDKVKVDTPIVVSSGAKSLIRHFAGYDDKNNMVEYFLNGATSLTALGIGKAFVDDCRLYEA